VAAGALRVMVAAGAVAAAAAAAGAAGAGALAGAAPLLLMPPWPLQAPRPPFGEVVPSLQGTGPVPVLAVAGAAAAAAAAGAGAVTGTAPLLFTPPCPLQAPRPAFGEVVPSLHGTGPVLLAVVEAAAVDGVAVAAGAAVAVAVAVADLLTPP
jgi:hypothetical protein